MIDLERYFDNELYLVRFNTIQDLKRLFKEDKDLKVVNFAFKSDYNDDYSDYGLVLVIEDTDKTQYYLDIYYAVCRNGERIIIETNFEECGD